MPWSSAIPPSPGPYVIRVKAPGGTKLMPHRHPEDRIYTVMSGVFDIGPGEAFDGVRAFPPGSVVILPGNTPHFHWAKSGEYVTQVTAIGPLGLEYVDPTDDPRLHHSPASLKCSVPTGRTQPGTMAPKLTITGIAAIPPCVPLKVDSQSDAWAWADRNLPAADSLLVHNRQRIERLR